MDAKKVGDELSVVSDCGETPKVAPCSGGKATAVTLVSGDSCCSAATTVASNSVEPTTCGGRVVTVAPGSDGAEPTSCCDRASMRAPGSSGAEPIACVDGAVTVAPGSNGVKPTSCVYHATVAVLGS